MFEGVVSQVLAGLLGRYVKGIQKEQLKIGIWNEEINLENVELILEAFDYLQLPFALKTGRIGKLSIKIPWKKLGWDPIIIVIEDVFVCAYPREDSEWGSESLGKRELAGKLAKLNAIELAKFSRRVTDNQTGQSLLSYMSAKANNSGKRDGVPQYDMTAELTALVLSIDEIQLQQILNLCDHFTICALRT
uniref:Chorein N-terminal domain-containing protein n=1 Tax=Aegilops tauschii subsp. strangulata TaxID=200361 RepID=A0A453S1T4_AEGTS